MDCCYYGTGKLYLCEAPFVEGWGLGYGIGYGGQSVGYHAGRPLGNATDFSVNIEYPEDNTIDRDIPYKNNCIDPDRITITMNLSCDSIKNKALAYLGRPEDVHINEVDVVDELVTHCDGGSFQEGDYISFLNPIILPDTLIIKRSDNLAVLTPDIDYTADQTGFTLNTGFASGINLLVSYTYNNQAFYAVEAFTNSRKEYGLFFKGTNESNQLNKLVTFYRVKFDPIQSFDYLTNQFSLISLTATVMPVKYSGSGLSDYFIERTA